MFKEWKNNSLKGFYYKEFLLVWMTTPSLFSTRTMLNKVHIFLRMKKCSLIELYYNKISIFKNENKNAQL